MWVTMSGSNSGSSSSSSNRTGSSIHSNHGGSNTGRRSSSNQKIDQQGQASTPAVAVGVTAVVNALAAATAATGK